MFFTFAVNTGLLISAKISVQTAADAAAYAGAATEARWLNGISFLNYDMRRQYKKYIFRTNFVGAIGNPGFPTPLTPNSANYDFPKVDNTQQNAQHQLALKVPVVCIPLTVGGKPDDNCFKVNIVNTSHTMQAALGGATNFNAISQALYNNINQITQVQQSICTGQGQMNLFVLLTWLFRGDHANTAIDALFQALASSSTLSAADIASAKGTVEALVAGLGLYPRNIINLMRINTLASFLNSGTKIQVENMTADGVEALEKGTNAEAGERTIQAFKSAAANLNTAVFDPTLTSMTELQSPNQIKVTPATINFNTYIQMMVKGATTSGADETFCNSAVYPFPALSAPIGVTIDPSIKVNYAVKVKAFIRPRGLLFLPGSDPLELDAVAGAKPFGSRVGPKVTPPLVQSIQPPHVNGYVINDCTTNSAACDIPYLDVGAGANTFSVSYLNELLSHAKSNGVVNFQGMLSAQTHAMAPTPEEVGHYNILPPPPNATNAADYSLGFIDYSNATTTDTNGIQKHVYRFYAPLIPNGSAALLDTMNQFLGAMFNITQVGVDPVFGVDVKSIGTQITSTLSTYLANIDTAGGELGETSTLASIELPMDNLTPGSKQFWLTEANQVLSSWAPDAVRTSTASGAGAFAFKPRFGYSVKFVSMQDLLSEGIASDDPDISQVTH